MSDGPTRSVLYPERYVWYVFASSLDIIFTRIVLWFGGTEVNTIADWLLGVFGVWGLIGLKFATVVLVVLICEFIGRRRVLLGRRMAEVAIVVSAMPVFIASAQLLAFNLRGESVPEEPDAALIAPLGIPLD
jgi:hypothetical protein